MSRKILLLVGLFVLAGGITSLWLLRSYSIEIVHPVVVNAVVQKAPADYPEPLIRKSFRRAYNTALEKQETERYLQHLLQLAQHLEKIQRLDKDEVDSILQDVERSAR